MKTFLKIGAVLSLAAAFSFAESWSGKLVDADCMAKKDTSSAKTGSASECTPTLSTINYGVQVADGKVYKLDASGNSKAAAALRADRNKASENVTISGRMEGQMVKVDSLDFK